MKEYRIKVTVRNNLLLSAIENNGYSSQAELARAIGIKPSDVNALVALRMCPIKHNGEFTENAKLIMEALGASPGDLWTNEQLSMRLAKNSSESSLTRFEMQSVLGIDPIDRIEFNSPDDELFEKEKNELISDTLNTLTNKEKEILEMRYGFNDNEENTYEKIANQIGLTKERIRQIESKALRKLRDTERSDVLKELL